MLQVHVPLPLEHVSSITNDGYVSKALKSATVPADDIIYKVITLLKLMVKLFKQI